MKGLLAFAIAVSAVALVCAPATCEDDMPLIPRDVLFGNPDKAAVRISPDGAKLSYLAPLDGVLNVWVGPADDPAAAKPVTRDAKRGIHIYFWAFTNRHIIYLQDKEGDENWRVYSVDLDSEEVKDLTPLEGVQARIQEVSRHFPEEILVALNDRIPQLHDIHRVNIETGEKSLVMQNPGYIGYMTDEDYRVRLAVSMSPQATMEYFLLDAEGKPEPFMSIGPEDLLTTNPVAFDRSGDVIYMKDSRGRNTAALMKLDLTTRESTLVAEDPKVDIGGIMMHPTEKTLQAYSTDYTRVEWHPLDEAVGADLEALRQVADGDAWVISRTLDDRTWMVAFTMDTGPVRYYRYDRESKQATFLFTNRRELEDQPLVRMYPVVIEARDGLELVSYLTLPPGTDPDGDGRPSQPVPLVLWVHGGPWARDAWGYNSVHQWMANRGYAALSVNYRGSTGYGKDFINAANGEWGRKMHDDLIDAVKWAEEEGIADEGKVAISGGSFGGYATLLGMTQNPEVFACGVDLVGVSNLVTFLENIPPYWMPMLPLLKDRVGDHTTEEGKALLLERSPISYVDRISKPLLIGQGANDPRVKRQESDQIVAAMQERDIPVTYAIYGDEGHGFARPENSTSFFAVAEAFLSEHLGGRFEPIGDDLEGASIEVPAGADQVPGLAEALAEQQE
jgi:dipeptidyl aminopeptidase/acylaminoacyl peptidase